MFVIDPALVDVSGAPRLAFMYRSLRSLDESLGGRLVIRHGDPATVVAAIAAEAGADEVVVSRDYAPYGRSRDAAVAATLSASGVAFTGKGTPYAVEPGRVLKDNGTPYAVFTPFHRAWDRIGWPQPLDDPADLDRRLVTLPTDGIPDDPSIGCELPAASEVAAHARWGDFVADGLDAYADRRNTPGVRGTSGMSPYLRWGQVHPRQLLADLGTSASHTTFGKELCWREFYADVLLHQPRTARENLQPKMDRMRVDTDVDAHDRFQRWTEGTTGYPIVDAGMRQLLATGWMHNRVRMITASFLVKDLHLPWQWGARHFMRHLVDGDLASNQHGWQWTAGTGTDASPYFRIFNPTSQGERFDPDGDYVRRWAPDSASLTPIVVHADERDEAMRRYQEAMGR